MLNGLRVIFTNHTTPDPLAQSLPLLTAEVSQGGKTATVTDAQVFELFMRYALLNGSEIAADALSSTQMTLRYHPSNIAVAKLVHDIVEKNKAQLPDFRLEFQKHAGEFSNKKKIVTAVVVAGNTKTQLADA